MKELNGINSRMKTAGMSDNHGVQKTQILVDCNIFIETFVIKVVTDIHQANVEI